MADKRNAPTPYWKKSDDRDKWKRPGHRASDYGAPPDPTREELDFLPNGPLMPVVRRIGWRRGTYHDLDAVAKSE